MSYLLRALEKSQAEREASGGNAPGASVVYLPEPASRPSRHAEGFAPFRIRKSLVFALIIVPVSAALAYWAEGGERWSGGPVSGFAGVSQSGGGTEGSEPLHTDGPRQGPEVRTQESFGLRSLPPIPASVPSGLPSDQRKLSRMPGPSRDDLWRSLFERHDAPVPQSTRFRVPETRLALSPTSNRARGPVVPALSAGASWGLTSDLQVGLDSRPSSSVAVANTAAAAVPTLNTSAGENINSLPEPTNDLAALRYDVAHGAEKIEAEPSVLRLEQLPLSILRDLPELLISIHAYNPNPDRRFIRLNRSKYREGERVSDDLWLQEITPEGAIFRFRDAVFAISGN